MQFEEFKVAVITSEGRGVYVGRVSCVNDEPVWPTLGFAVISWLAVPSGTTGYADIRDFRGLVNALTLTLFTTTWPELSPKDGGSHD
jgi:hypothetical protein